MLYLISFFLKFQVKYNEVSGGFFVGGGGQTSSYKFNKHIAMIITLIILQVLRSVAMQ